MRRDKIVSLEVTVTKGDENFTSDVHLYGQGQILSPENMLIEIIDGNKSKD